MNDQSNPPPDYAIIFVSAPGGGKTNRGAIGTPELLSWHGAVAACWDHRARIVDEKIGEARDESYERGKRAGLDEAMAAFTSHVVAPGSTMMDEYNRERQALGIEKAAGAIEADADIIYAKLDGVIGGTRTWLCELAEKVRCGEA